MTIMTSMILEIYDALKAAGAPEDKAKTAARAFGQQNALTKADIRGVEKELVRIDKELFTLKWMVGVVIAVDVIPLLKNFF